MTVLTDATPAIARIDPKAFAMNFMSNSIPP
jgi:hypothetical protein